MFIPNPIALHVSSHKFSLRDKAFLAANTVDNEPSRFSEAIPYFSLEGGHEM